MSETHARAAAHALFAYRLMLELVPGQAPAMIEIVTEDGRTLLTEVSFFEGCDPAEQIMALRRQVPDEFKIARVTLCAEEWVEVYNAADTSMPESLIEAISVVVVDHERQTSLAQQFARLDSGVSWIGEPRPIRSNEDGVVPALMSYLS